MVLLGQSKFVFHLVYEAYFGVGVLASVGVLVICILVVTVFCIVCTVFFVLFRLCTFILICFVCTSVRTPATE